LRRIPAMVSFLNPQPTLSLVGGNRSLCPEAVLYGSPEDCPGRWQADLQCPLNSSTIEKLPHPPKRFATRATSWSALERKSLRRGDVLALW